MNIFEHGVCYELKIINDDSEIINFNEKIYNFYKTVVVKDPSIYKAEKIVKKQKMFYAKCERNEYIIFTDESSYNNFLNQNGKNIVKKLQLKK